MKPPKSKMAELGSNATGGEKSHAETAESAEFKMTELGPIPVDWEVKRLGEIAMVARGGSPRPIEAFLTSHDDGLNWVKIGDVGVGAKYIERTAEKILPGGLSSTRMVYPGDFLLSNSMSFGRPYIMKIAGCIHDGWLVIQDYKTTFDTEYLYYVLGSEMVVNQYRVLAAGSSVLNLNKDVVARVTVVVPPLAEQRRIAGALSDVDELISALGKLIEKKRNIKTSTMQELLTGKTRLPGFKGKWVEKTFCEFISRFATGLNPRQNFKLNSGGNNYYITIKDFKNGKISFNGCDKVDDLALRLINERSDLRAGDLLFSSIGRVGDAYVIKDTPSNWNINESVFSLRPDERQMDVNFLYYLVKSSAVQERLTSGITGSTLTGIKIGELRGIVCFYPNELAEQKAIAAVLSDIDAEIAALEADRTKYERIKSGMMQELLTGKTRLKGD